MKNYVQIIKDKLIILYEINRRKYFIGECRHCCKICEWKHICDLYNLKE